MQPKAGAYDPHRVVLCAGRRDAAAAMLRARAEASHSTQPVESGTYLPPPPCIRLLVRVQNPSYVVLYKNPQGAQIELCSLIQGGVRGGSSLIWKGF